MPILQVLRDSTQVAAVEPVLTPNQVKSKIKNALNIEGWSFHEISDEHNYLEGILTDLNSSQSYRINIFYKPVNSVSRGTTHIQKDKRVQPGGSVEKKVDYINIICGVYSNDGVDTFIIWKMDDFYEDKKHTPKVQVDSISLAVKRGIAFNFMKENPARSSFLTQEKYFAPFVSGNMNEIHLDSLLIDKVSANIKVKIDNLIHNLVIYGAPGIGKSNYINQQIKKYFSHDFLYERIVFHSKTSYGNFFGTYKPKTVYKDTTETLFKSDGYSLNELQKEPLIDYQFEFGPFLNILIKALKYPKYNFLLLIEEINRGNAGAIFGDLFQLLDRDSKGNSKYEISLKNEEVAVINKLHTGLLKGNKIKLPSNLYIWATMNSGDQGVFPMDSAFKRRWNFEYMPLNKEEDVVKDYEIYLEFLKRKIKWNQFREIINNFLISINVPEDRLIGPFFLTKDELANKNVFINKILLYLRDDVLRHQHQKLFVQPVFSIIVEEYSKGNGIFVKPIHDQFVSANK